MSNPARPYRGELYHRGYVIQRTYNPVTHQIDYWLGDHRVSIALLYSGRLPSLGLTWSQSDAMDQLIEYAEARGLPP